MDGINRYLRNAAVVAGDITYRRRSVTPDDANALRELMLAGGTFDEELNSFLDAVLGERRLLTQVTL